MIRTRCVHSPVDPKQDGLRILATRFRGRGMPVSRYDVWMPNLGPSEMLLKGFLSRRMTWAEFSRRYLKEIMESGSTDRRNVTIKNHGQKFTLRLLQKLAECGNVTLLCHCAEDEPHCHRHLLKKKLDERI
jgi:uncharacterized protein YeaO (DUF488 family)